MTGLPRHCQLLAGLLLIIAPALCAAKDPGGEGFIKSQVFINNCFKTSSGTVTEVCADYRINWKMWSLMGEPVGDYNLGWQLNSITLMDPKRQQVVSFTADTIPAELKKDVGRIELYVDGVATVRAANGAYGYHHFDTGTAVKAGGRSSVNSPGSPNWNKLFSTGGDACDDKQAAFMDAKKAKEAFISGIQLSDLKICPRSSVTELSALESAIAKLCKQSGADKQHRFCPEAVPKKDEKKAKPPEAGSASNVLDDPKPSGKQGKSVADLLDEGAERQQVSKQLTIEREKFRKEAAQACSNKLREINACYTKANCKIPTSTEEGDYYKKACGNEPDKTVCTDRKEVFDNTNCPWANGPEHMKDICKTWGRKWECLRNEPNPKYPVWEACAAEAKRSLAKSNSCVKACNPNGFSSESACVEQRMASAAPTESDARAILKKEWDAKSRAGNVPAGKNGNQAPTNFLD
jgi:hypothetical protein